MGQNYFVGTSNLTKAVQVWYNEVVNFNYGTKAAKMTGHYTQVSLFLFVSAFCICLSCLNYLFILFKYCYFWILFDLFIHVFVFYSFIGGGGEVLWVGGRGRVGVGCWVVGVGCWGWGWRWRWGRLPWCRLPIPQQWGKLLNKSHGMGTAGESRCYIVISTLIGWAHTQIYPHNIPTTKQKQTRIVCIY